MTLKDDINKGDYKLDEEGNKIMIAKKPNINCIPHSKENMTIIIGDLKFIDSLKNKRVENISNYHK